MSDYSEGQYTSGLDRRVRKLEDKLNTDFGSEATYMYEERIAVLESKVEALEAKADSMQEDHLLIKAGPPSLLPKVKELEDRIEAQEALIESMQKDTIKAVEGLLSEIPSLVRKAIPKVAVVQFPKGKRRQ